MNAARDQAFARALEQLPLVAILRGVQPREIDALAVTLYDEGFRLIEVPMNSPRALESISLLATVLPPDAIAGAGTVLDIEAVQQVRDAGGSLIVMPHTDLRVISAARRAGMACIPGAATPTEALCAARAGADALKLFPAEMIGPDAIRAMRAILPRALPLLPVGGITPCAMSSYLSAGATGFGLGSAIYKPGLTANDVGERARQFVRAWRELGGRP